MKPVQKHLHSIQSNIIADKPSVPSALCSGDIACLMDQAVQLPFTTHKLKCINVVKLFHGATFISELCNMDGTQIWQQWYIGDIDHYYSLKPLRLHQTRLNHKSYILWQQLLHSFTVSPKNQYLLSPLGCWHVQQASYLEQIVLSLPFLINFC